MLLRKTLAGLAALGLSAGVAGAQTTGYPTEGHVWHGHVHMRPAISPTNVGARAFVPLQYPPPETNRPSKGVWCWLKNACNSHGVGCWSHQDRPTCGSLRAELAFIFGSCRTFFNEPCMHGPPQIPVPTPGSASRPPHPH